MLEVAVAGLKSKLAQTGKSWYLFWFVSNLQLSSSLRSSFESFIGKCGSAILEKSPVLR